MPSKLSTRGLLGAAPLAWLGALGVLSGLGTSQAAAQSLSPGSRVQASPTMMEGYWQECTVVSGPDQYGSYRVNCGGSDMSVPKRWIRASPTASSSSTAGGDTASGQSPTAGGSAGSGQSSRASGDDSRSSRRDARREARRERRGQGASTSNPGAGLSASRSSSGAMSGFGPGSTVLASPSQMNSVWKRCQVRSGPGANGYYSLDCVDEFQASDGTMHKTLKTVSVPGDWIKADDPGFRPDLQVQSAGAEQARNDAPRPAAPPPPPNGAASSVALGAYECWAFNTSRMNLNFQVTGPGSYRASDGSSGRFTFDPASKRITFTGYLAESMPDGFTSIYHEPKGIPTVSFRGRGGDEVSFCEKK